MKITVSYTKEEAKHAQRVRTILLRLFNRCRVHSSQTGDRFIDYLTFRF